MSGVIGSIRILCVDDHGLLMEGLRARLDSEPDMMVVGCLSSAAELAAEVQRLKPDIVLLDIEMPGPDVFESAEDLRRRFPFAKVAILSAHVRDHYLTAAFRAGVWGYFAKGDEIRTLVAGLRRIARGEFVLGASVAERAEPARLRSRHRVTGDDMRSKLELLTGREQEVLRLIGRGLSRAKIAETLARSPKTVDGHRERIMEKLDIHTSPGLVRFAIREGLVEV
jgi:two-component system NarL family response regulator